MNKTYFLLISLLCFNSNIYSGVEVVEGSIHFYPWVPAIVEGRDRYNLSELFNEALDAHDRLGRAVISSGHMKDISEYREFAYIPKYFPIKFFHDDQGRVIYDFVEIVIKGVVFKLRLVCSYRFMKGHGFSSPNIYLTRLMKFLRFKEPQVSID
jgi:hypothetical protein